MKCFIYASLISVILTACAPDGGSDFIRATNTFEGVLGQDKTVSIGIIDPTTRIVSVEIASASSSTTYKTSGDYYFQGVHHGGVKPGVVVLPKASAGDLYRIKVK